jgi:hypothetical protein
MYKFSTVDNRTIRYDELTGTAWVLVSSGQEFVWRIIGEEPAKEKTEDQLLQENK